MISNINYSLPYKKSNQIKKNILQLKFFNQGNSMQNHLRINKESLKIKEPKSLKIEQIKNYDKFKSLTLALEWVKQFQQFHLEELLTVVDEITIHVKQT